LETKPSPRRYLRRQVSISWSCLMCMG